MKPKAIHDLSKAGIILVTSQRSNLFVTTDYYCLCLWTHSGDGFECIERTQFTPTGKKLDEIHAMAQAWLEEQIMFRSK